MNAFSKTRGLCILGLLFTPLTYASANIGNPECLYQPDSNGLCKTGFISSCRSPIFCQKKRKKEAAQMCASHRLDIPADRAGLIDGCYLGTNTCYCAQAKHS
ncbi:hypothetical protein [Parashewanella tropica]|uniref:hypothetical protein n=1 Tax=Parashewanella tropica TaxID=2547970 RepID=UPI001059FCAD|nr:hypothetical protein [Parashewanella tropica]